MGVNLEILRKASNWDSYATEHEKSSLSLNEAKEKVLKRLLGECNGEEEVYEREDIDFDEKIEDRVKENIDLYYKDKSLIKDKEVLEILNKASNWLFNLLTDDLNNLKTFEPKYKMYYNILYGHSKDNILLAYDKKNGQNDIHYVNFYNKFKSYMSDYITDCKTLTLIIHEYLVNTLQMEGSRTEAEDWALSIDL